MLREADIPFVIMVIPQRIQIAMHRLEVRDNRFDVNKPAKLVTAFGSRHEVPVFDLMPLFLTGGQEKELYFPVDGHPNATATRLIAEGLNAWLRQLPVLKAHFASPGSQPKRND